MEVGHLASFRTPVGDPPSTSTRFVCLAEQFRPVKNGSLLGIFSFCPYRYSLDVNFNSVETRSSVTCSRYHVIGFLIFLDTTLAGAYDDS